MVDWTRQIIVACIALAFGAWQVNRMMPAGPHATKPAAPGSDAYFTGADPMSPAQAGGDWAMIRSVLKHRLDPVRCTAL
jgi:hypothetical protein